MPNKSDNLIVRPPVVAVMGHIDHGKSTLLDYIRKSNTTAGEVGGITQGISAYEVVHNGKRITFLDTPGHAAFISLRDRGAYIADIAILVVSAEDGVKPQTLEALQSIKTAKIPYIVAINKIDKENANVERTKQNLAENDIFVESYGGEIPAGPISAKTGQGVPEILDMIALVAEIGEYKADPSINASGIVLESERHKSKGVTATLVIKEGTLKTGMFVVAGESLSPIRILQNFKGEAISEASFSSPVRVIGFDIIPPAGTTFETYNNKKEAESAREENIAKKQNQKNKPNQIPEEEKMILPVTIKANNAGTIEAIEHEIAKISHERLAIKIISKGIGEISEGDVKSAGGKEGSLILGFSVGSDASAKALAERLGITIIIFDIIYKLTEYLEALILERAPKIEVEEKTGVAKVLKFFSRVKDKQVIGARAEEGVLSSNAEVRIMRREAEIGRGHIRELQRQKMKVGTVEAVNEFGAMVESKIELAPGDKLECFKIVQK